jgi:hypothetical protein
MKKFYIFCSLFFSLITQPMENIVIKATSIKVMDDHLENEIKRYAIKSFQKNKKKLPINNLVYLSEWATNSDAAIQQAVQEYQDKDKNSVTHLLVKYGRADDLYFCAERNMIVLMQNKKGQTPYDIALKKLSNYIKKKKLSSFSEETIRPSCRARCCYYILYNYTQAMEEKTYQFSEYCCDNHILIDKNCGFGEKQEI